MNDLLGQAARQYAARDYRATESVCRTIIGADPHHFDALHLLGVVLTLQDRPEEAVTFLRAAQVRRPDHAQMLINLGRICVYRRIGTQPALARAPGRESESSGPARRRAANGRRCR